MELSSTITGMMSLLSGLDHAIRSANSTPATSVTRKLSRISLAVVPMLSHQLFFAAIAGSNRLLNTSSGEGSTYFLM